MQVISLDQFRLEKTRSQVKPLASACAIFNTVDKTKLSKFCVHCKYQNTEQCPNKGQVGFTRAVKQVPVQESLA